MPYTVAASFDKFRENIELSGDHRRIANSRRERLVSLLSNDFEILEAFPSGSIPRYTAIRGYADLDVIVALHYGKHIKDKKPSHILQQVRDCLGEYKTNVKKNGQAVTLYYKTWPDVDIVPVKWIVDKNGHVIYYEVPDMNREIWIPSLPKKHSLVMTNNNIKCGVNFKRIIKMIKWWNNQHSSLIRSFHIEVMALKIYGSKLEDYSWDVYKFFNEASVLASKPLWHDISFVDDYLNSNTRKMVLQRLESARDKALRAWYLTYGKNNEHEKAIKIWSQIFGDKFPSYG